MKRVVRGVFVFLFFRARGQVFFKQVCALVARDRALLQ